MPMDGRIEQKQELTFQGYRSRTRFVGNPALDVVNMAYRSHDA